MSHDHKTGAKFANFFEKTEEITQLVTRCHILFRAETSQEVESMLFPNKQNQPIACVARYIKSAVEKYIGVQQFDYGPNAIRKAWETFATLNPSRIPEQYHQLFRSNTGHCSKTAEKYYVRPMEGDAIKEYLAKQREIVRYGVSDQISMGNEGSEAVQGLEEPPMGANDHPENPCELDRESHGGDRESIGADAIEERVCPTPASELDYGGHDDLETCSQMSDFGMSTTLSELPGPSTRPAQRINSKYRNADTDKMTELRKRLMSFKGANDPLRPTLKRAFVLICKEKRRLTKDKMREILLPLNLNSNELERILTKAYTKYNNLVNRLEI